MSLLAARQITKRFPGVVALNDVSFDLMPGELHAICGENGAGKSTLIKLLSGIHPYGTYEGDLLVDGCVARFQSTADAGRAGLAVIYQELALVEEMSVAENIFLGSERLRHGLIDWPRTFRDAAELLDRFDVKLDPAARCDRLGIGQKQLVEIVKALGKESRVLVLDEPTAALAEHEVQVLLKILRDLKARGLACIYISHRLDEVFAIADRITVLRDGSSIATFVANKTSKDEIIRNMVGRQINDLFPKNEQTREARDASPVFSVSNLSVADPHTGRMVLHNISFSLAPGEVLGIGGLMGAGRTELLMHLFGAWGERRGGTVTAQSKALPPSDPAEALRNGLALVTEDRRRYGLVLEQDINFNLSLSSLAAVTSRAGLLDANRERQLNEAMFQSLQIKAPSIAAITGKLSGGNQQKVVIGKALLADPKVVFLDEPTRGIDVAAKVEIYELVNRLTAVGKAVVLVSSELIELLGISHRILMLHEGRIAGEFRRGEATQEILMTAALAPKS